MSTLEIILVVVGLEAAIIAFLLTATILTQASKSGGKVRLLGEQWESLFPTALAGDPEAVLQIRATLRSKRNWKAFHSLVDERLRQERGRPTLGLRRLSRHVGLTERLQRELLGARDPLDRAAAGKTLARLRERIAEDQILDLLESEDPAVVLTAAYATASFRDPRQFLPVFRAVYGRTPITLHGAAELLTGFEEGICPAITKLLEGVVGQYRQAAEAGGTGLADPKRAVDRDDTAAQVVIVDLLAFYAYRPAASTLSRLLTLSRDEELLIHLVKAISTLGDASAVPRLVELLTNSNWVIRMQSAQALAELGAVDSAPSIHALADDHNLMVRTSVHQALETLEHAEAARKTEVVKALA